MTQQTQTTDPMSFMQLIWPGPLVVQGIRTAAQLRLADLLAQGPLAAGELAGLTGSQPRALERLLKALSSTGVFSQDEAGHWQNTHYSDFMREDHPKSMRPWALLMGHPLFWRPMGELPGSIASGRESFTAAFQEAFYDYLKTSPEAGTLFNQAMAAQSSGFMDKVPDIYDFSRFETLADLGGGTGTLLANILRVCPRLQGVLVELADVIAEVDTALTAEFGERLHLDPGNFLEHVPPGLDCYMTVRVLHSMADDQATLLLGNIRQAMNADGTLLLLEGILDDDAPANYAMMDMLMLVLAGSMERTEDDFRQLLDNSGFVLDRVIRDGQIRMMECRPR